MLAVRGDVVEAVGCDLIALVSAAVDPVLALRDVRGIPVHGASIDEVVARTAVERVVAAATGDHVAGRRRWHRPTLRPGVGAMPTIPNVSGWHRTEFSGWAIRYPYPNLGPAKVDK